MKWLELGVWLELGPNCRLGARECWDNAGEGGLGRVPPGGVDLPFNLPDLVFNAPYFDTYLAPVGLTPVGRFQ